MNHIWSKISKRATMFTLGGALLLPTLTAHAATPYKANSTDTLWVIAQKFEIPLQQLMNANPEIDPLNVYEGISINLPNGGDAAKAKKIAAKLGIVQTKSLAANAPSISDQSITTIAGESLAYRKVLNIKATAYSDADEENGWGPIDYFGNRLKLGTIAVDPSIIPFHSKLYIVGYDFNGLPTGGMMGTATDSGSAIKGNRIDIFVPGSPAFVNKFGIQYVKVYILE
ncbi:MAG: 3D domain-containing protein [Candidatus Cohnella colombiensis]|uniref:3D domain-containing protein n=1 Tax=Candidatus Cohnella colombiensis TaxID=3121368 RepID=A0AA95ETX2_9BACL|nr:MAG: 3D domain-containing protein [Cohnella sp.]